MIDPDDPRLTAHALGELDDPAFAASLDEADLLELAELRALAGQLEAEFAAEPRVSLGVEQRAAVFAASSGRRRAWLPWVAAAGVAALVYGGVRSASRSEPTHQLAQGLPKPSVLYSGAPLELTIAPPEEVVTVVPGAIGSGGNADGTTPVEGVTLGTEAPLSHWHANGEVAEGQVARLSGALDAEGLRALRELSLDSRRRLEGGEADSDVDWRFVEVVEAGDLERDALLAYALGLREPAPVLERPFVAVAEEPRSTFSVDVDTASYALMRRDLTRSGRLPDPSAVRVEEWINTFDYGYAPPRDGRPFAAHAEVAACPWAPTHRLVRIGLKGAEPPAGQRPASNLVFLLDVSGSMSSDDKLPLLKQALRQLTRQLRAQDRVAIVVYAGASGLVLDSTAGDQHAAILRAIDGLEASGSTNGGAGIELAYSIATQNYLEGGVNRVILATDGDFNVGVSDREALTALIERKAQSKVFLSVLGLGMQGHADATLEQLADHGDGSYAYLDTLREAHKVLVTQASGTLHTIAKDVKLQLEFNPARVASYRLIGYESRTLANRDFADDAKDAGEIGAGHTVTALYEVVPAGAADGEPLRYQPERPGGAHPGELLFLKLRYKTPEGDASQLMELPVQDAGQGFQEASEDFRFAAAVAAFGLVLRGSAHAGSASLEQVQAVAQDSLGPDRHGYRAEFLDLVRRARELTGR
ncbi:MAG: VWA domain-containing protein [Planctomycetota bacterium]